MNSATIKRAASFHNAIRRYCVQQIAKHRKAYAQLIQPIVPGGQYTDEALNIFPRYNVLQAILNDIERFVPGDFTSLEEAREVIVIAGETAHSRFTLPSSPVAVSALADERRQFVNYVLTLTDEHLALIPQLPFRRILSGSEASQLRDKLIAIWGKWYGGFGDRDNIPPVVTLHVAALDDIPDPHREIRAVLAARGITRLIELQEFDESLERDLSDAELSYNLSEAFWTAGNMEWMIYASHEASITFGSRWLIDAMQNVLPRFSTFIYKSWALEDYGVE